MLEYRKRGGLPKMSIYRIATKTMETVCDILYWLKLKKKPDNTKYLVFFEIKK